MDLDASTLQTCGAALVAASASLMALVRHRSRDLRGTGFWVLGLCCVAGAFAVPALLPQIPSIRDVAPLLLAGLMLLVIGIRRFHGATGGLRRSLSWMALAFVAILLLRLLGTTKMADSFGLILAGLAALLAARRIGRQSADDRLVLREPLTVGFSVLGFSLLGLAIEGPAEAWFAVDVTLHAQQVALMELAMTVGFIFVGFGLPLLALEWGLQADVRLARTDELTGLPNRRGFFDTAQRLARRASVDVSPVTVLMLDLDNFSGINRLHGHAGGDCLLAATAAALRLELRPQDLVGRLGGEEFCICLVDTSLAEAQQIADRLRRALAGTRIEVDGAAVGVSVSIGVAALGVEGLAAALREADKALYAAKAQGRDRVCYDEPPSPLGASLQTV